ncbi:glycoside hydrolase family 172 protein [Saccharicrinis sp. GN24d3]|uniref:glycoside hydrolase family 172 protein n=1 Tax=Saccharicrinis sp. GN24d3 TaxID=3458416 RepID=UPI004036537E
MMLRNFIMVGLFLCVVTTVVEAKLKKNGKKGEVSFRTLLEEMIDRDVLTRYPDPYYTFKQFSSYDRRSTAINDSTWFANSDCDQFIRVENNCGREESVLMDTNGAGSIVRFWLTGNNHGAGTLRIYLDGNTEPVIETKLIDFISKNEVGVPLSSSVSSKTSYMRRGHNLYLPIPYAKSCKVTYEMRSVNSDETLYYCINTREYAKGTKVVSFSPKELEQNKALIRQVNEVLSSNGTAVADGKVFDLQLPIGKEASLKLVQEGLAINSVSVKIHGDNLKRALRDIIVKCTFDGEQTVWCPIGDFFGTGYELHPSETFYTKVETDGNMTVYWLMPYLKNCTIAFENIGNVAYRLTGNVTTQSYEWTKNSMYFHASWKQYTALSTGENKARIGYGGCFDMNFVTLNGKGVYVGDVITLFNTSLGGHWKSWWGEGDEKVYLDGEAFPSVIGTGTEDYYGYAWCEYAPFNHPYLSQPIGGGNFKFDMTVNMRYRGLDAMPFAKSLKFDMEMWHWTKTRLNFAPTTFYYLLPGGSSNIEPDYDGAKAKLAFDRFDILKAEAEDGKLEGENLRVIGVDKNTYGFYHDNVSGGVGLIWRNGELGETRTFEFDADTHCVLSQLALASSIPNGVYEIALNGEIILEWSSTDCNKMPQLVELGKVKLQRTNTLRVKLLSKKNDDESCDFIIDYLLIDEKAE